MLRIAHDDVRTEFIELVAAFAPRFRDARAVSILRA
jgi:hypothetical protein